MTDRAKLERDVIEAAQAWNKDAGEYSRLMKAVRALDACPPEPEARAFTEEQLNAIRWIATSRAQEELRNQHFEKRLAALEAAGPSTTPTRLNLLEERVDKIFDRLMRLEHPPAPAPQPEAKGMTVGERWLRGAGWIRKDDNSLELVMVQPDFEREARELEISALEEARALTYPAQMEARKCIIDGRKVGVTDHDIDEQLKGSAEATLRTERALDRLLASKREGRTRG